MNIYITQLLSQNRKGRFLQNTIAAKVLESDWRYRAPINGLLIIEASEINGLQEWQKLYNWAMHSGCAVLVINPSQHVDTTWASLIGLVDWQLAPIHGIHCEQSIAALLSEEIDFALTGFMGDADPECHQIDGVDHTRYIKKHSNSGLFAMTTLPICSLSLLNHQEILLDWLAWFIDHAGVIEKDNHIASKPANFEMEDSDFVVLLMVFAGQGESLNTIIASSLLMFS
jgi:hypothetical protein